MKIITALRVLSKDVVLALALLSVINFTAYVYYPQAIIPVYKTLRTAIHGKVIQDYDEVYEVFKNIKKLLPAEIAGSTTFEVRASDRVNAWVDHRGHVVMTTGFIQAADYNKAAIALVLGHELAHFALGHTDMERDSKKAKEDSVYLELMADDLGLLLALGAGYNACDGAKLWDTLTSKYGMDLYTSSHPTHDSRAKNIERLCARII